MAHAAWHRATKDLPTTAAKIRALAAMGAARADIARFLDIRYQQVRNVLTRDRPKPLGGMAETAAPFETDEAKPRVMPDGSVVIPAALAKQLGAEPGETLGAFEQDGGIWIATRKASRRRAQAFVSSVVPEGVSLVEDLLAQRRREVEEEERQIRENGW
ncbi:MAG: AbrB/MazE/SpoVT family DNA-binding domain-containing protein [Alphaproteobacteria bacterium]|nr:AbrB/MazE/SpoVT family DNA-binding domain-containing protein [Alphaproteobacteria bacterium]